MITRDIINRDWNKVKKGFVVDGDWDVTYGRFMSEEPSSQQVLVEELFVKGLPVRRTQRYRELVDLLERGIHPRGMKSIDEVEQKYFPGIERTFRALRDQGYKTQRELARIGKSSGHEINVVLDRHGHLLLLAGKHRFAMCGVLGIEEIPINVTGVHRLWAQRCVEDFGGNPWDAVRRGIDSLADVRPSFAMA